MRILKSEIANPNSKLSSGGYGAEISKKGAFYR